MKKPENGAEKIYFVLGKTCIAIYEWNDHYIKEDKNIEDIIIFDVSSQQYYNWEEFIKYIHEQRCWIDLTPAENARKALRQLRYKVYKPVDTIQLKKILKTKKKIENKSVCSPGAGK